MENEIEIDANAIEEVAPDDGQASESDAGAELTEEELELFDYTQFADQRVRLQVNGEEIVVPLQEALAGYQRQADYTRKTQELAEQRKQAEFANAISEALEKNPAETLKMLQEAYGVAVGDALEPEEEEWLDPAEQKLREMERRLAVFEEERAMQELQRTLDSLQTRYGEAFNADEVVARALAEGNNDLEAVFKKIAFDKVFAVASESQKKLSEEEARIQAKRDAAIISGGTSSKQTAAPKSQAPKSVFEAFEQARKSLNL